MKKINFQSGQAIILLAFAIVGLVGFAALAIDGGRALSDKRHAQNAADNSAFAAALAKIRGQDYTTAALNRAASNGYNNGANPNGSTSIVEVNLCSDSGITCQGLPVGAVPSEYIRVKITSTINTTFARVLGRTTVLSAAEAVARASGVTVNPLIQGAALAAFQKTGTSFTGTGNGQLNVIGSGIFSNSTDTDCPNGAMKMGGSITYDVDTAYAAPGSVCTIGGLVLGDPTQTVPQVDTPEYDIPSPLFTCSGTGSLIGNQYQPGNYNGLNIHGDYDFAPGNYCFNGNVKLLGGDITAHNVNFRMNSGAFTTSGSSTFTCSNMVFYSTGGSGITFNGGNNNCTGITFFMESGDVHWTGNSTNSFTAPTSGGYKGLFIYLPNANTSDITVNGNSGSNYTGSIIAIGSSVTINGGSNTDGLHTQVLANDIIFSGNGNTVINFNPDELYHPPQFPTIELIK
jgi:Flp pilus assembly protein TadG